MKKIYLIILISFIGISIKAQNCDKCRPKACDTCDKDCDSILQRNFNVLDVLREYIESTENTYNSNHLSNKLQSARMVSDKSFRSMVNQIFSKVITDNDDVVKNGRAANYSQTEDKTSLSFSQYFDKKGGRDLLSIYASGNTQDNFLFLKNPDAMVYGLNVGIKHSRRILKATQNFDPKDAEELRKKRYAYTAEWLAHIYCLNMDTTNLISSINCLKNQVEQLKERKLCCDCADMHTIVTKKDSLETRLMGIREFQRNNSFQHLRDAYNDSINSFELRNARFTGYRIWWFEYGLDYTLDAINIYTSNVAKTLEPEKSKLSKWKFNASLNLSNNSKRNLYYASVGLNIYNSYWIESQRLTTYELRDSVYNEKTTFKAFNNINNTHSLSTTYVTTSPYFVFYTFPCQKVIGLEAAALAKLQPQSNTIFNARIGILYSVHKDDTDLAKGTVGIFLTLNDYDSAKKWDNNKIGIGLKVGLPFDRIATGK